MRIASDGTPISSVPIVFASSNEDDTIPVVTSTREGWIVAWVQDDRTVAFRSVATNESLGDVQTVSGTDEDVTKLAIAADLGNALLAWPHASAGELALHGALITPASGSLVEPVFTLFSSTTHRPHLGGIAAIAGELAVTFDLFDANVGATRSMSQIVREGTALGAACVVDEDCVSAPCIDGVCCTSACGGGGDDDCRACSIAAGGAVDGICSPRINGSMCRAAVDECDVAETCDGASIVCPLDVPATDGTGCPDGDACNGAETCIAGECSSGTALVCNDGDACTTDSCDATLGCQAMAIPACGVPDGGVPDASVPDASVPDMPSEDTGNDGGPGSNGGCGCTTVGTTDASHDEVAWACCLLLLCIGRRRRRRSNDTQP
jgi:hypothetical protein